MNSQSCFICGTAGPYCVKVSGNRYVCIDECLDQWESNPCPASPPSDPSSPEPLSDSPPPFPRSPESISLQQSLIVLITSHILQRLLMRFLNQNNCAFRRHLTGMIKQIAALTEQVGHVSLSFLDCSFPAIKHFFETNTFYVSTEDLPSLSSISSFFKADVRSVFLCNVSLSNVAQPCYSDWLHCVSGISISLNSTSSGICDDFSFTTHFSGLKTVNIVVNSPMVFSSFCQSFLINSRSVEEINLKFRLGSTSKSELLSLGEVFSSVKTLKTVTLEFYNHDDDTERDDYTEVLDDEDFANLFNIIAQCSSIRSLNLTYFITFDCTYSWTTISSSVVLMPLFKSNSLKSLAFPQNCSLDSRVCNALKNSLTIEELTLNLTESHYKLCQVLSSSQILKKLKILKTSSSLSPIFESLGSNTSLLELEITHDGFRPSFNDREAASLKKMLQFNSTLLVLNLDGSLINSFHLNSILDGIQLNSGLKTVGFPHSDLSCLTLLFEAISRKELRPLTKVYPHYIDFSTGSICYDNNIENSDLVTLSEALKSNVPIKRVDCRRLSSPNLEGLIALFEILSINKSLIDVNISPILLIFLTPITPKDISNLQSFLELFKINKCILYRCNLSDESITALCTLIKDNHSLTSLDLSYCPLSHGNILKLIHSLKVNSALDSLSLENCSITLKSLQLLFEFISTGCRLSCLHVSPHSINTGSGLFCFAPRVSTKITTKDVSSLKSSLKRLKINKLEMHRCRFSNEVITAMCDLIRANTSLTSIDFRHCELSGEQDSRLMIALQSNSHLTTLSEH
ncbi:hypothetical protein GEMRC1_001112 [Eukaryota sp. GEM-RC1]